MRLLRLLSPVVLLALGVSLTPGVAAAQGGLARRIDRLLDAPPFARAHWGVLAVDETGRERYARNAERLFVPASTSKLVVTAAASALLSPEFHPGVSVYGTGPVADGVLAGDLVIYGRGDPMYSARCYGADTLAAGACDSVWTRMDALADSIAAHGLRHVTGAIVGDGSYFDAQLVHPAWESYDLNWWYAAPVSGLGFNDNSVDVTWGPGPDVGAPAAIAFAPELDLFTFENRTSTAAAGARRSIDFFRHPGTMQVWAEGTVPLEHQTRTEYFALPDPNRYFAAALRAALAARGVSVAGPTSSTTDGARYRAYREVPALVTLCSRRLADYLFPILNSSQNWFAEMLLKTLAVRFGGAGSWDAGLEVEWRFLVDSMGIDSTQFALVDGSGLAAGNLITPLALVRLLRYMQEHPNNAGFLRGLPRSGQPGSLRDRFVSTPLAGRVVAKTGSINRVNSLAGYVERADGRVWTFAVMVNGRTGSYNEALARIDAVVGEMGR